MDFCTYLFITCFVFGLFMALSKDAIIDSPSIIIFDFILSAVWPGTLCAFCGWLVAKGVQKLIGKFSK